MLSSESSTWKVTKVAQSFSIGLKKTCYYSSKTIICGIPIYLNAQTNYTLEASKMGQWVKVPAPQTQVLSTKATSQIWWLVCISQTFLWWEERQRRENNPRSRACGLGYKAVERPCLNKIEGENQLPKVALWPLMQTQWNLHTVTHVTHITHTTWNKK